MKSFTTKSALALLLASTSSASPIQLSERGTLSALLCLPYNILINDLTRPASAVQASAYCSSLIAKTTTVTKTSTSTFTKFNTVNVLATDVTTQTLAAPTPTVTVTIEEKAKQASCGQVGYDKSSEGTRAYYSDSTGTQATFEICGGKCKADAQCGSFAYGGISCLLYGVGSSDNVNLNPASPYTFFDKSCSPPSSAAEVATPVKRNLIALPYITPPAGLAKLQDVAATKACQCLIDVPATVTDEILKTVTSTITLPSSVTKVVGTSVVDVYTTPEPVTVTKTVTVGA